MIEQNKLIELVLKAQSGDDAAFDALFNESYNEIYYFILKTVKDADLAADLTQETFLTVFKNIKGLNEPAAYVSWIRKIAYRHCANHFQKKRDVLVEEDEDGNSIFDTVAEEGADFIPHEALDQEEFRKTILKMIESLSEEQRSAVLMYYYQELSVAQIAEIQGVSEGTVKSRLNYARKAIKASVEKYEEEHKIKLHAIPFFPFIGWLFKMDFSASKLFSKAEISAKSAAITGASTATSTVAATATYTAAKVGLSLGAKVAAGIIAGAVVIGAATAGIIVGVQNLGDKNNNSTPDGFNSADFGTENDNYENDGSDNAGFENDSDRLTPDGKTITEDLFFAMFEANHMGKHVKRFNYRLKDPFATDPSIPFGAGVYYVYAEDFEAFAEEVYDIDQKTLKEMRSHPYILYKEIPYRDGDIYIPAGNGYYLFIFEDNLPVLNGNNPFLPMFLE